MIWLLGRIRGQMCRDFGREAEGREALKVVPGEQPGVSDVRPAQGGLFGVWGTGGGDAWVSGKGRLTQAYAWFPARRAQRLSWKEAAQGLTPQRHPPS